MVMGFDMSMLISLGSWSKGQFTWVPSHLRSIHAILTIESMKTRTYHYTRVPSHLRSIHAISTVESMEVGTYHYTRVPRHLRRIHAISTVGSTEARTYHYTRVPGLRSQVWHGCLHDNTFWRRGSGLVLRVLGGCTVLIMYEYTWVHRGQGFVALK